MGKRRTDYSDFEHFIKTHPQLKENDILKGYKESGGKGKRQTLQEKYRDYVGKEKGEFRNKPTREVVQGVTKKRRESKKSGTAYSPDRKIDYTSQDSKHMLNSLKKMYGYKGNQDSFLKVKFKILSDEYTTTKNKNGKQPDFGFFMKDKPITNFKTFIRETIGQAEKYYNRLAKRYNNKNQEVARVQERIANIKSELKGSKKMTVGEVTEILSDNGFMFEGIEQLKYEIDSDEEE